MDIADINVPTSETRCQAQRDEGHIRYLPTQDEIAEACKRIQEGWSRTDQHRRRAGTTADDYSEW